MSDDSSPARSPFTPYSSYSKQQPISGANVILPYETDLVVHDRPQPSSVASGHGNLFMNIYWTASAILGFKERQSLLLCFVFGGALIGFCLARAEMMNPTNLMNLTVPGEWFWYRQTLYKPAIILHIYCTIIAGFFAVFQFLPAIRRRKMILHRMNGYLVIIILIIGIISGSVVGRRAFGGAPSTQAAFYTDGILIVFSVIKGYVSVRETRKHRRWMLRAVTYTSAPITARIILVISRQIITNIGSYYSLWTCAEVQFLQQRGQGVPDFATAYPTCVNIPAGVNPSHIHIAVHAAMQALHVNFGSAVRETFGMALWLALVIHISGVEIYIRATEATNRHRRGFILERGDPKENSGGDR
ncbi:hypothetical protein FRB97_009319 [Tulasnella sp. 331]|nr:hypothetical protein FRB97_009319 [Tulasnella sp. 331]